MLDEVLFLAPYPDSVDDTSCSSSAAVLGHWCPITYTFAATDTVVDLLLILYVHIAIIVGPNLIGISFFTKEE